MKNRLEGHTDSGLEIAFRRCLSELIDRARNRKYSAEGDPGDRGSDEYDDNAKKASNRLAKLMEIRNKYETIE